MVHLIPTAFLLIIGYFVKFKKVTWLISGYNTASQMKKDEYDVDELCRLFGNLIFLLACIFFLMSIISIFIEGSEDLLATVGFPTVIIVLIGGIIYLNTAERVKRK